MDKILNIKIKNFKLFQDLELDNIKRVNLIGGKNNIGKTALLEAIELVTLPSSIIEVTYYINRILSRRYKDIRNFEFDFISNDKDMQIDINHVNKLAIELFPTKQPKFRLLIDDQEVLPEPYASISFNHEIRQLPIRILTDNKENLNNFSIKRTKYIPSNTISSFNIALLYSELVELDKEEFLNNSLKIFDKDIVALKQITKENEVILKIKIKNKLYPLSSLGEGINRFITILCAIWASQDGYLLIDEIENGIHYTHYKKLWEIIFKVSKEANCQVFITTHSKECIEMFNEVNQDDDGCYLELYKNKKDNIVVKQRGHDVLQYSLTHNGRFRGE